MSDVRESYASEDSLSQATLMTDLLGPNRHLLTYVWAHPDHRGEGRARSTMEQIRQDLERERGTIVLSVEPDGVRQDRDTPAVQFLLRWYASLGYSEILDSERLMGLPAAMYLTYSDDPDNALEGLLLSEDDTA